MKSLIRTLFLLCMLGPVVAVAGEAGIKVGLMGDGELETSERMPYYTRGTSGSYAIGLFADQSVTDNFAAGVHLDAFNFTDNYTDKDLSLYEVGVHLKSTIALNAFDIRPGVGVGYGQMDIFDETSTHLLLQAFMEIVFYDVLDSAKVLGEVGFVTSPDGGVDDLTDITFGPMFFYRMGISF